jgi:hypothetical protein
VGIRTKSLVEVQCDLCEHGQTVEVDRPPARLDALGYRRVKLAIEPLDPELASGLASHRDLVLCRDCLAKVKQVLRVQTPDDAADEELGRMKRALRD